MRVVGAGCVALGMVVALAGCGPDRTPACVPAASFDAETAGAWPLHARLASAVEEVARLIHERIDDPGYAVRTTEAWLDEMSEPRRELPGAVAAIDRALGERRFDAQSEYAREVAPALASANAALDAALRALAERDPAAAGYIAGRLVTWLDPDRMVRAGSP